MRTHVVWKGEMPDRTGRPGLKDMHVMRTNAGRIILPEVSPTRNPVFPHRFVVRSRHFGVSNINFRKRSGFDQNIDDRLGGNARDRGAADVKEADSVRSQIILQDTRFRGEHLSPLGVVGNDDDLHGGCSLLGRQDVLI